MNIKQGVVGAVSAVAAFVLLLQAGINHAAEIKVLSANGYKTIMDEVGPQFEKASGHKLAISYAPFGVIVKRAQDGEAADLVITPRQGIDSLVKEGKAAAGNVTVLASSHVGVAVRKGVAKPDISSPDALKRALLAAKSVSYSDPKEGGASGVLVEKTFDRLGIAKEMKPKTVLAANTVAMATLVASGKADLLLNQIQNLVRMPGAEVVGPLPGNLQEATVFASVIPVGAKTADAAKALVAFLRGAEAVKVHKAQGMEPG